MCSTAAVLTYTLNLHCSCTAQEQGTDNIAEVPTPTPALYTFLSSISEACRYRKDAFKLRRHPVLCCKFIVDIHNLTTSDIEATGFGEHHGCTGRQAAGRVATASVSFARAVCKRTLTAITAARHTAINPTGCLHRRLPQSG